MKKFNKNSVVGILAVSLALGLAGPLSVLAATAPSLGAANGYSVFGKAGVTNDSNVGTTHVWGNVGADATNVTNLSDATQVDGVIDAGAGVEAAASAAYTSLDSGGQGVPTALNLAGTNTVTPGVYTVGATTLNGTLTLDGAGVYIFRSSSSISTSGAGTMSLINGATACNVFWEIPTSMTIGAGTHVEGTIIAQTGLISLATGATLKGRAISLVSQVTMDSNQITEPVCAAPATLHVIKHVVNDNEGTAVASAFNVHVKLAGVDVAGSPAVGVEAPGTSYSLSAGTYVVSEDANSSYSQSFSGDCDSNGVITLAAGEDKTCTLTNTNPRPSSGSGPRNGTINVVKVVINDNGGDKTIADFPLFLNGVSVTSGVTNVFSNPAVSYLVTETTDSNYVRTFSGDCNIDGLINLNPGDNKFCIITNDDIGAPVVVPPVPPLIEVIKVPNPLALPNGAGPVEYTYTLKNIGTVPVTDITMVGDTCSPINLISGDTNSNAKLEVTETWVYRCATTLAETHTNTIVATGWANGLSATDIASATVVVGTPIVPPLIHITKVPKPLTLLAGGGMVTYTEKVTNPGKVALNNITLTDDKCSPMKYISGDTNGDTRLDVTETWTYTCQTKLTKTTTNTAVATGEANGLKVRDIAIATVTVASAVPTLPNTGLVSDNISWNIIMLAGVLALVSGIALIVKKRT